MSIFYDLVINCDLKEDTPGDAIEAVRCLTTRGYELAVEPQLIDSWEHENVWESFSDRHFLAPDPEWDTVSKFLRMHRTTIPSENNRPVYRYVLQYAGRRLHDDFFNDHHLPFLYWLATVSYDKYIGYYMISHDLWGDGPRLLLAIDGVLKVAVDVTGRLT